MKGAVICVVLATLVACISGIALPSFIQRCKRSDPAFADCLEKGFADGVKKFAKGNKTLGISPLEPFHITTLDLGESNAGSVSLAQKYDNVDIYGITDTTISKLNAKFEDDECYWNFEANTPVIRMESDYILKGKVLVFPINGKGRCNNTLYELKAQHKITCEKYLKKDVAHYKITDYKVVMEPKDVKFDFKTVIQGNKKVSDEIVKTVNENALAVFADVKPGFEKAFAEVYKHVGNNFFNKVSAQELFLD